MFAIIKFTDEESSRIVSVEDIKHFDPANINYKKKYLVKFQQDYYPAQIIMVKGSIEELEECQKKKRLPFLNKHLLESASESDDGEISLIRERKEKKRDKLPVSLNLVQQKQKLIQGDFLKSYEEQKTMDNASTTRKTSSQDLFKNEELKKLQSEIADLKIHNKELSLLNIQLQKQVIDCFNGLSEKINQNVNVDYNANHDGDSKVGIGVTVKDQVHLGRGIYLSKSVFNDHWARCTSGPHFVKNIAVSIFGTETLLNSSVTGRQSNRIKKESTKPALDGTKLSAIEDIYRHYLTEKDPKKDIVKEIKSIRTYISNKISDLTRTQKRHNKQENDVTEDEILEIEAVDKQENDDLNEAKEVHLSEEEEAGYNN